MDRNYLTTEARKTRKLLEERSLVHGKDDEFVPQTPMIKKLLIVDIKSVDKLLPLHSAQLITYMRLHGSSSGLLMNFNVELLPHGIKRILL